MDISYLGLGLSVLLLIFPLLIFSHLKLKLSGQLFNAFARMIVQLAVIGITLQFIFAQMNLWLTLLWMLIMVTNAVLTLKGRLKFQRRIMLPVLITALGTTSLIIMPWILILVIKPIPLYSPMFAIPIYGMVLGNSMNSCALALERFESGLSDNWKVYYTRLSLGANLWEATLPVFRKAMQTSLMPQLLTIASIGVVSLPGMMTGQILGGASPLVAIKYQMMIMISIFAGVSMTDYTAIRLYLLKRFDKYYLPQGE
ncbi:MAG TPA: ABC transporter permease [Candidatus Cloacimonadota bacterium]|jgi:putative ABC transport system permease protein|nr:ABC transporter permease [Candidatus Cloacimonadota bacterium]